MFSLFERKLAFRYLRAKRKEGIVSLITVLSVLGITLGVATLIIVMAVMNGYRIELTRHILGFNGHMAVYSNQSPYIENPDEIVEKLRSLPYVTTASKTIDRQAMILKQSVAGGAFVRAISENDLKARTEIVSNINMGNFDNFDQGYNIVIGAKMAQKFQVLPGDNLTMVSPKGSQTAFGTIPKMRPFKVVAVFEVGMEQYDNGAVFMSLDGAQKFFDIGDNFTGIEIFTTSPDTAISKKGDIINLLGPDYLVADWLTSNASFIEALNVERNVMFLILTLIIFIASFNIISSLIMLVKDKSHDIAILRTMGATRGAILRIFFLTGASTGIAGTVVGVILGVSFAWNIESIRQFLQSVTGVTLFDPVIYFLAKLPAVVEPWDVFYVVAMSLTLSFLATLYPARRAASLDPVEAMRYE